MNPATDIELVFNGNPASIARSDHQSLDENEAMNQVPQSFAWSERMPGGTYPNDPTFQVAGTEFSAFRVPDPRVPDKQWWALRVVENGKVFDPRDGSSHDHSSVPKLQVSIEDALARAYENDPDLLRRGYGLPPRLERIRAVCAKANVEVGHYDDPHASGGCVWYYRTDGREEVDFRDEAFAGLSGLRDSSALQDFLLTAPRFRAEDDTFMLVDAERWLDNHAVRLAEDADDDDIQGMKP